MIGADIKARLDEAASRINNPSFIDNDPVQFTHRLARQGADLVDIETVALLTAHISWGRRPMILRNCQRMLDMMGPNPGLCFVMEGLYEKIPDEVNIHRTFFGRNLKYICRGLREIYMEYGTMQNLVRRAHIADFGKAPWHLLQVLNSFIEQANKNHPTVQALPLDYERTAAKRFCMMMRWLVRNDGIVDTGVWDCMKPSDLFIPLDVHVGNTSRLLGLIDRKQNDRRTVEELTAVLRTLRPHDPCLYDFALFGLGITQ